LEVDRIVYVLQSVIILLAIGQKNARWPVVVRWTLPNDFRNVQ